MTASPPPRAARSTDAAAVRQLVRAAHLNPIDLDWRRFLVIERAGLVVAAAQLRPPSDGWRELASVVVSPLYQNHGLGSQLVHAWQQRAETPLYLFCADHRASFYRRFGFRPLTLSEGPRSIRRLLRLMTPLTRLLPRRFHFHILCWYPGGSTAAASVSTDNSIKREHV